MANDLALAFRFKKPLVKDGLKIMGTKLWEALEVTDELPDATPQNPCPAQPGGGYEPD